ncbi:unnamed protein product [Didymodactylos carnosus]|uniref:Uncharacterized protein n=1 Tax=Didymodactylos carnosus TaxID=1234261 RepID=A0A814JCF5_9BILA|nr:unnamed protein product [Didymodactylos carnosus]CAF3804438.1 unnamed protein product [Didymodactylos carnosus]
MDAFLNLNHRLHSLVHYHLHKKINLIRIHRFEHLLARFRETLTTIQCDDKQLAKVFLLTYPQLKSLTILHAPPRTQANYLTFIPTLTTKLSTLKLLHVKFAECERVTDSLLPANVVNMKVSSYLKQFHLSAEREINYDQIESLVKRFSQSLEILTLNMTMLSRVNAEMVDGNRLLQNLTWYANLPDYNYFKQLRLLFPNVKYLNFFIDDHVKLNELRKQMEGDEELSLIGKEVEKCSFWTARDDHEGGNCILYFRHFIADIHRQLVELPFYCRPFTVYGTQMMRIEELKNLQKNIGEIASIKTFFSGTMCSQTVLSNAVTTNINPLCKAVLFEIAVDCTSDTASFGKIQTVGDQENYGIMFSPGSVFRIESVAQIPPRGILHVKLSLTDRQLSKVRGLFERIRNEFAHPLTLITLGNFFCEVGQLDEAMRYYEILHSVYESDNDAIEIINCNIGLIYEHKSDYEAALGQYHTGLNRTMQSSSSHEADTQQRIADIILKPPLMNHSSSSISYFNLGCVYFYKLNYKKALENFEQAYDYLTNDNTIEEADILNNIGCVYYKRNDFQKALQCYEKALDRALKILPAENLLITCYLKNISTVVNSVDVNK